jgi:hypothetical protein
MSEQEYIDQRVSQQIIWYSKKSSECKGWFIGLKIFETALALSIPVMAGFLGTEYGKLVIGIIGVLVAITSNLITLLKLQENWIKYRVTSETLKHEKFLFVNRAGPYRKEGSFPEFVERFESYISKENVGWSTYIRSASRDEVGR